VGNGFLNYDVLKTVSQIGTYTGVFASWFLTWVNLHFKTAQEPDSGHRKILTPAGRLSRILLVCSFVLTISSAIVHNYADSKLRKAAEQRGTQAIQAALEDQHKLYVSDLEEQFEGKTGVIPKITEETEQLKTAESRIVGLSSEAVNQMTGDGSYFYLMPNQPMSIQPGIIMVNALPEFVGKYPVHDLFVSINGSWGYRWNHYYGTYFPNELGRPREGPALQFKETDAQPIAFYVSINGSNGNRGEIIRFEKSGEKWLSAMMVSGPGTTGPTFLCVWVEPGFPPMTDQKMWPRKIWSSNTVKRTPATAQPPCK
jgi:hypothetical protein